MSRGQRPEWTAAALARSNRALKKSGLFGGASVPLELYLFDRPLAAETASSGPPDVARWQRQTINAVLDRINDPTQPPIKCFTCEHAFVGDCPPAMGLVKRMFDPSPHRMMNMAFCAACVRLGGDEIKRRALARLKTSELVTGSA
jgi:hypothetical protein